MSRNILLRLLNCDIIEQPLRAIAFGPNSAAAKCLPHARLQPANYRFDCVDAMKQNAMQVPRLDYYVANSIIKLGTASYERVKQAMALVQREIDWRGLQLLAGQLQQLRAYPKIARGGVSSKTCRMQGEDDGAY